MITYFEQQMCTHVSICMHMTLYVCDIIYMYMMKERSRFKSCWVEQLTKDYNRKERERILKRVELVSILF